MTMTIRHFGIYANRFIDIANQLICCLLLGFLKVKRSMLHRSFTYTDHPPCLRMSLSNTRTSHNGHHEENTWILSGATKHSFSQEINSSHDDDTDLPKNGLSFSNKGRMNVNSNDALFILFPISYFYLLGVSYV